MHDSCFSYATLEQGCGLQSVWLDTDQVDGFQVCYIILFIYFLDDFAVRQVTIMELI
jgi:hypothetical protein